MYSPQPSEYVNPQIDSKLFSTALELREDIYGYLIPYGVHASISRGRILLSVCVQDDPNRSRAGDERSGLDDDGVNSPLFGVEDPLLLQRLRSTWGPHWKCQELASRVNHSIEKIRNTDLSIFQTCKRLRSEMMAFIFHAAILHVTDLDMLQRLLGQTPTENSLDATLLPEYLSLAATQIHNLSITLRLPLKTFRKIERFKSPITKDSLSTVPAWIRLCPAMARFERLQKLHLWVDHTSQKSWTMVSERAFLAPLNELLAANPELKVYVNLPFLHPHYETPKNHFVPKGPPPPYTIGRRLRQRLHALTFRTEIHEIWVADFPIMYKGLPGENLERKVEFERMLWEKGHDVEEEVRLLNPTTITYENPRNAIVPDEDKSESEVDAEVSYSEQSDDASSED
ncbi:hypothetical protein BKA66DRAFT_613645 [Pyrenochaeta sp. MPI-SDFR-AT-0127]|nr:hypothetical protein BKA66DRAFT_613645 [Pyrenochaeta sp. MPI-SDFR-AT-0127]